jgi:hypothetical protein
VSIQYVRTFYFFEKNSFSKPLTTMILLFYRDLSSSGLTGVIIPSFGNLSALNSLYASYTKIKIFFL